MRNFVIEPRHINDLKTFTKNTFGIELTEGQAYDLLGESDLSYLAMSVKWGDNRPMTEIYDINKDKVKEALEAQGFLPLN